MEEKKWTIAWYRLRGLGLFCLSCLVFFFGAYVAREKSITTSSTVDGREIPISCVSTGEKKVALTFDADRDGDGTAEILRILETYQVKATFFVTGSWVEKHPEEVKAIAAAGHELGNHSETHKDMSGLTKSQCQEELMAVHERVKELTGQEMKLFRPPYGEYDNEGMETVKLCGYLAVLWDVDSMDWKDYGAAAIAAAVTANPRLGGGSILRMHNGARYTAEALEKLIPKLQELGYTLVPASELVYFDHYYMDGEGRQFPDGEEGQG